MNPKLVVLYIPSLEPRRLDPAVTPFVWAKLAQRGAATLETHPSAELLPTILTGVWPHEHRCWQLIRRPPRPRSAVEKLIDLLPDQLTTAAQCVRHLFDSDYDIPTIEPRRRRQFELARIKTQRREGGDTEALKFAVPSVFDLIPGEGRFRTLFSLDGADGGIAGMIDGQADLDIIELYTLDLYSHWNLDQPDAMRDRLATVDRLIADACAKAEALGLPVLLVVDHGQELVRHTIDLGPVLRDAGVSAEDFTFYCEVGNARFWFDTPEAKAKLEAALRRVDRATYLTAEQMAEHHIHFAADEGYGDGYLICDAGTVLFPHDYYHPLVNAYMARKTSEQAPRKTSPVHRGNHGGLPGKHASDTGTLLPLTGCGPLAADQGQLIDVAPTILALMGEAAPETMKGRSLLHPSHEP